MTDQTTPDPKTPPEIPKDELKFPNFNSAPQQSHTFRWVLVALIFVLAAILIALLVWLYTMRQTPAAPEVTPTRPTAEENDEPESTTAEAAVMTQQATSPSTDLTAIETDLAGTQFPNLEPLFADVEAMF